jgi:hypothetical protein
MFPGRPVLVKLFAEADDMNLLLVSIGQHPWAALGLAVWSLCALSILKECVALAVTGQRPPAPPPVDWDAYNRSQRRRAARKGHAEQRAALAKVGKEEEEVPQHHFESSRLGTLN